MLPAYLGFLRGWAVLQSRSSQDAEQRSAQAAAEMDVLSEELHAKDEVINSLQRELRTARSCLAGREHGMLMGTLKIHPKLCKHSKTM